MSDIKIKPDWPENKFSEYFQAAKSQLGELWTISDDARTATCANLKLSWSERDWNWVLEADGREIGRFIMPFQDNSYSRFRMMCSIHCRIDLKVVSFNCQEADSNGIDCDRPILYANERGIKVVRIHYSSYGAMYFMEVEGLTVENKGILSVMDGTWESLQIETL